MSFDYVVYQTGYTARLDPTLYTEENESDETRPDIESMIESFRKKNLEVLAVHDFCVSEREHYFTNNIPDISTCQEIIRWVDDFCRNPNCSGYIILKSTNGGIDGLDALQDVSILNHLEYCQMYPENWDYEKFNINGANAIYFDIDAESG